jgi:bacillithiol system protein YtxJ
MKWNQLTEIGQLALIKDQSFTRSQVIFKHSTRCSISSMALHRLEREAASDQIDFYYLDLLQYRSISYEVAELFSVHHESPQILLIKNGQCVYDESHQGITMQEIEEQALAS